MALDVAEICLEEEAVRRCRQERPAEVGGSCWRLRVSDKDLLPLRALGRWLDVVGESGRCFERSTCMEMTANRSMRGSCDDVRLRPESPETFKSAVKRDVRGRLAIIGRRTVTERKTFEVDVSHEELQIRYELGDGTKTGGLMSETYSVLLHAEQVEITKHIRAVTEVRVSKRRVLEHKRFDVILRHETLDISDQKSR